jgi:hypothetical protein
MRALSRVWDTWHQMQEMCRPRLLAMNYWECCSLIARWVPRIGHYLQTAKLDSKQGYLNGVLRTCTYREAEVLKSDIERHFTKLTLVIEH